MSLGSMYGKADRDEQDVGNFTVRKKQGSQNSHYIDEDTELREVK